MATKLTNIEPSDTALVLLYDARELAEVQLDKLRAQTPFEVLISAKQVQAILLSSDERSEKVTIQPTRIEFRQELRIPFEERSLEDLQVLLELLPELSVKAFGLNYTLSFSTDGYETAGQFLRDRFLKQPTGLDEVLGGQLISNSSRMIFGDPEHYRDIRLTPADLKSNVVVLQYHYHKEESVKDKRRMFRLLSEQYPIEAAQLSSLILRF